MIWSNEMIGCDDIDGTVTDIRKGIGNVAHIRQVQGDRQ